MYGKERPRWWRPCDHYESGDLQVSGCLWKDEDVSASDCRHDHFHSCPTKGGDDSEHGGSDCCHHQPDYQLRDERETQKVQDGNFARDGSGRHHCHYQLRGECDSVRVESEAHNGHEHEAWMAQSGDSVHDESDRGQAPDLMICERGSWKVQRGNSIRNGSG